MKTEAEDVMGSGCTKTEAGDVQQTPLETVDGEPANGTHSADSKKGMFPTIFLFLKNATFQEFLVAVCEFLYLLTYIISLNL